MTKKVKEIKYNWLPNIFDNNGKIIKSFKKQTLIISKLLEDEYNKSDLYWETRPTRIFWLDSEKDKELYNAERSRLFKVLNKNYYNKKVLEEFFQSQYDDEALDKINNTPKHNFGVYFPIKIKSENKYLPLISFSGFIKINNDLEKEFFDKPLIALKSKLNFEISGKYMPEIALYEELEGKSYDLAFVTAILLLKHRDLFNNLPNICCSGIVDEYGNIKRIDFAKEKCEAAKKLGFDYLLFPNENKEEINETDNTLFFSDIIELNNWIVELANNKAKSRVIHWLSVGGEIPTKTEFNSFFSVTLNKGISYWQNFLKYVPIDEAIKKIKIISENYFNFTESITNSNTESSVTRLLLNFKNTFAIYRFYALIPELIYILKDCNKLSDYLYDQIKEAVRCQSPDFAIATKTIRDNHLFDQIITNKNIREKYPQLLCFYFNHPTELIYLLSISLDLTKKEILLLEKICNLISNKVSDDEIINTALKYLNPIYNYDFKTKSETIPHSHQLALLESTIENFNSENKNSYIRSIKKYYDNIVLTLNNKNKDKLENQIKAYKKRLINRQLDNENMSNDNLEDNFDIFEKLLKLYKRTAKITDCGILALSNNIYQSLKTRNYRLSDKLKKIKINVDIVNNKTKLSVNNYRNKFFSDFCNSLNLGKMGELITECIAFFYGKYVVRWDDPNDLILLTQNKFDFPFSIGLMCQKHSENIENFKDWYYRNQYPKICLLVKEIFNRKKPNLRQLMWLYLLYFSYNLNDEYNSCYNNYEKIIVPELEKYLLSLVGTLKENSEFKREFEFIAALFRLSHRVLGYNNFENDVTHAFIELEENPLKTITRTEQLLYAIFYFLQEYRFNTPSIFEVKKFGSQLNNARFVIEFIRTFGCDSDLNELFRPIHGFSDLEKQLFEAMTIIRLDQESKYTDKYMLKNYILNNIRYFSNLRFALSLISKY